MQVNIGKKDGFYIILLIILLSGTLFLYFMGNTTEIEHNGLSALDKNFIVTVASNVVSNSDPCFAAGLERDFLIQDFNGVPYGIPICVTATEE